MFFFGQIPSHSCQTQTSNWIFLPHLPLAACEFPPIGWSVFFVGLTEIKLAKLRKGQCLQWPCWPGPRDKIQLSHKVSVQWKLKLSFYFQKIDPTGWGFFVCLGFCLFCFVFYLRLICTSGKVCELNNLGVKYSSIPEIFHNHSSR